MSDSESSGVRERRVKLLIAMVLVAILVFARACAQQILATDVTVCALRMTTHLPCPFCGLTRALSAAMLGDLAAAFGYNPLWPLAVIAIVAGAITLVSDGVRGAHLGSRILVGLGAHTRLVVGGLVVFTILRWVRQYWFLSK